MDGDLFMKKIVSVFAALIIISSAIVAYAADIAALDKVNVMMTREKVLAILGSPTEKTLMAKDLIVETYSISDALPLIQTGCIYDAKKNLVGQSFVFQGNAEKEILERLKKHGYFPLSREIISSRLAGFDDDTGRPVVAVIEHHENLTTITTFEKSFYESRVK
jgi:hypothetical protein